MGQSGQQALPCRRLPPDPVALASRKRTGALHSETATVNNLPLIHNQRFILKRQTSSLNPEPSRPTIPIPAGSARTLHCQFLELALEGSTLESRYPQTQFRTLDFPPYPLQLSSAPLPLPGVSFLPLPAKMKRQDSGSSTNETANQAFHSAT